MQILDQAVAVMQKRGVDGATVAKQLEKLADVGERAARVWKGYLEHPGPAGDKYSLITWMGPQPARDLFSLSLEARSLVDAICAAAGPEARFLVMDESPILMAYVGLKDGETGPQAAADRMAMQLARNAHFRKLADRIRSVKPGGGAAKPVAKAKAKKKPKAVKPVKKVARKKVAKTKAATKKKPAKKKK